MKNKITVFALSASDKLANDIAEKLGTKVGKSKVHHFADGEILVEIDESQEPCADVPAVCDYPEGGAAAGADGRPGCGSMRGQGAGAAADRKSVV